MGRPQLSTYKVDDLAKRGSRHAFGLLLQHIRNGDEPFVTYGAIARLLEARLRIPRVFPTHIGAVAGTLMNEIESIDGNAPPINGLITRPSGVPGARFGDYYDRLWRAYGGKRWECLSRRQKLESVEEIRSAVRRYGAWDKVYHKLFGTKPPAAPKPKKFTEIDGKPPETGRRPGAGESEEHRKLKEWAAANPQKLGLSSTMKGTPEMGLLSGDRIDVLFSDGRNFVAVEVKSVLSSEDDWRRGIYQCVKYRAVLQAQERPVPVSVRAMLLTEKKVPPELVTRARELKVMLKVQALNLPRDPKIF